MFLQIAMLFDLRSSSVIDARKDEKCFLASALELNLVSI